MSEEQKLLNFMKRWMENIKETDKTPKYRRGEENAVGKKPTPDAFWLTPHEIAEHCLMVIEDYETQKKDELTEVKG